MSEYGKLAATHPTARKSLLAQISAARLCLNRLNRPQDALKFFEAASSSAVPHLDLDVEIESGMREARNALSQSNWFQGARLPLRIKSCLFPIARLSKNANVEVENPGLTLIFLRGRYAVVIAL